MKEYLIWSNQHGMWWGPDRCGYTRVIDGAGRYTKEEAEEIVRKCTVNGLLTNKYYNITLEQSTDCYDEVMVKWVDFDPKEDTCSPVN
jgi:hypothetical protein